MGEMLKTAKQPIEEDTMATDIRDCGSGYAGSILLVGDLAAGVRARGSMPNAFDLHSAALLGDDSADLPCERFAALRSTA